MSVIVKTSLDTIKEYKGKNITTKVGGKKHQVFFKVIVDDFSLEEALISAKSDKNVLMLDYEGSDHYLSSLSPEDLSGVYIGKKYEKGNNITEQDVIDALEQTPEGVVPIISLPIEYKDIKFVHDMSTKYPRIRFCGGYMFCIEGCNLGCCGRDILDKKGIKYDDSDYLKEGCCCALNVLLDSEVELSASAKAEKVSSSKSSGGGKPQKTLKFNDLLYGGGTVSL